MSARSIVGIMNVIAKARVPSKSQRVHQKLMLALGALAMQKIDDFEARDIATTLNAFAKKNLWNSQLFETAAEADIPIIGTFTSQGLAITVIAFAKMDH
eukprot:scaffold3170_cov128-Cylindrotheca_fusiformis.AAC.12